MIEGDVNIMHYYIELHACVFAPRCLELPCRHSELDCLDKMVPRLSDIFLLKNTASRRMTFTRGEFHTIIELST